MDRTRAAPRSASGENRRREVHTNSRPASCERRASGGTPSASTSVPSLNLGDLTAASGSQREETTATKLHVVCRVRPMSDHEKRSGTVPCVTASTEHSEVVVMRPQPGSTARQVKASFRFDDVLTSFSTQSDVYVATLKPLIREVLQGYEAAAFAYGQTGTGKTYTMEGCLDSDDAMGLVPRASAAVIQAVAAGNYISSTITASCLEIYNEELTDLLLQTSQQQKLDLKETGHGVVCFGLSEHTVATVQDVQVLISTAQERRRIAETRVNARSSRSHCLFTLRVCVRQRVHDGEIENTGKLHLVDLAGSECAKKSSGNDLCRTGGNVADAERERRNINQSLLTLGRVIAALREESSRVPYRDSKLTRLLQEALGGCCRTVMIATISPAQAAVEETISTLAYAEQAMGIQNRVLASSTFHASSRTPSGSVSESTPTAGLTDGCEIDMKLAYLTQEVEEAHAALVRKDREAQDLNKQVLEAEVKYAAVTAALEDCRRQSSMQSDAMREQVRGLHCAASKRLNSLMAPPNGLAYATGVVEAVESMNGAWEEQLRLSRDSFVAQQGLLDGLVSKTRTSAKHLGEMLSSTRVQAAEMAASETVETVGELGKIDAATSSITIALESNSNKSKEETQRHQNTVLKTIENLNASFQSGSQSLVDAVSRIACDIEKVRATASATQKVLEECMATKIGDGLTGVEEKLNSVASDVKRHVESIADVRQLAMDEQTHTTSRRESIVKSIGEAEEAQSLAIESAAPLVEVLGLLVKMLPARRDQIEVHLNSSTSQLRSSREEISDSSIRGHGSVEDALRSGGEHLISGWVALDSGLDSLKALLRASDAADSQVQVGDSTDAATLAKLLLSVASSLDAAKADVARDVAELRQQRQAEERLVAQLARQREELQSDVSRAQGSLTEVSSQLEAARATLQQTEEEQALARETSLRAVMSGVEALVRTEMDGLGRKMKEGGNVVRLHLSEAGALCEESSKMIARGEEQSSGAGQLACEIAHTWASASDVACDRLDAVQPPLFQAARKVETAATGTLEVLVSKIDDLKNTQDAMRPCWDAAKTAIEGAVSTWSSEMETASMGIDAAISKHALAANEVADLQEEASRHCAEMEKHIMARSEKDKAHSEKLAGLHELQREAALKDMAAASRNQEALEKLGDVATATASTMSSCVPKVSVILQELQEQIVAISTVGHARDASLRDVATSVNELPQHNEAALEKPLREVSQLEAAIAETCQQTTANEITLKQEVGQSLQHINSALEAQRTTLAAAEAGNKGLFLELEKMQCDALHELEGASAKVLVECTNAKALAETKSCEERAQAACQLVRAEIKEHSRQLTDALEEEQELWQVGLSREPILAFSKENMPQVDAKKMPSIKKGTIGQACSASRAALQEVQVCG